MLTRRNTRDRTRGWGLDELVGQATYQLWTVTSPLLPASFRRGWKLLAYEYCVLVLPVLLGLTLLAEHPVYLNAVIYACVVVAYLASWSRRKSALYQADKQRLAESPASVDFARSDVQSKPRRGESSQSGQTLPRSALHRPFVSVWRAHMMLMTVLCILAVDFPVFPRRFGKCESWGTSLVREKIRRWIVPDGASAHASNFCESSVDGPRRRILCIRPWLCGSRTVLA